MKVFARWALFVALVAVGWAAALVGMTSHRQPAEPRTVVVAVDLAKAERHGKVGWRLECADAGLSAATGDDAWYVATLDNMKVRNGSPHRLLVDGAPLPKPHALHAWIGENPGGYSFWGSSAENGAIYLSLPADAGPSPRIEVEWHLRKAWTTAELTRASVCALLVLVLGLAAWRVAPERGLAAGVALVELLLVGCCVCIAPGVFMLESAAHVRETSMLAREMALGAIAAIALAGLAANLWRRRGPGPAPDSPLEAALRRATSAPFVFAITLAALLLVVLSMRSAAAAEPLYVTGGVGGYAAAARLPWADAGGWFNQSLGLSLGREVDWGARRPVHALIRAGGFVVADGSFDGAAFLQVLLLAFAVTALVISVARALNPLAAVIAWLVATLTAEGLAPSFLSEAVGMTVGCGAAALLIRGISSGSFPLRAAGAAVLSIALSVRPGPMFMLAVPVLLELPWRAPRRLLRVAAVLALALLGPILSSATFSRVAAPFTIPNANAAHVLYGLAHGVNWLEGQRLFYAADPKHEKLAEKDAAPLMMELAWKKFREDPSPAIRKAFANGRAGVEALFTDLPSAPVAPLKGVLDSKVHLALVIALAALAVIGIAQQLRRGFLLAVLPVLVILATVASLPMIWGDARWRGLVTALPLLALAVSFAAVARNPWRSPVELLPPAAAIRPLERAFLWAPAAASVGLMLLGLAFFELRRGSPPTERIVSLRDSAAIYIVDSAPTVPPFGVPAISRRDFLDSMAKTLERRPDGFGSLSDIEAPFLLTVHSPNDPAFWVPGDSAFWTVVPGVAPGKGRAVRIVETGPTSSSLVRTATKWEYVE